MRSVHDCLAGCLELARPLPPLEVVLHDAVGCTLAEDVAARGDLPHVAVATTPGYAVRTADLAPDDGAARLRVLDDVVAGSADPGRLVAGTAVRIVTGAPVPAGADAVVPAGRTDRGAAVVVVQGRVPVGANVRAPGAELRRGAVVLEAGVRVGPRQVAVLAAAGRGRVPVQPRPRVVVVPVGDDLAEAGRPARAGRVVDVDGPALAAAAHLAGAAVFRVGAVTDDHALLRETLEDQVVRADLVVVTGGLGPGHDDTLRDVLGGLGDVRFDDVALTPGGRLGYGVLGDGVPVVALPGDPVAAQVGFELFVHPMLRALAGEQRLFRPTVEAACVEPWESPAGLRQVVPVRLVGSATDGYRATPSGPADRPTLVGLAGADALAVVPEDVQAVGLGDVVPCLLVGAEP